MTPRNESELLSAEKDLLEELKRYRKRAKKPIMARVTWLIADLEQDIAQLERLEEDEK